MLLMDMTIKDFVEELGSSSPAPGGGTIAAVNGAFAAGLGTMVCELTLRKPKNEEAPAHLEPSKTVLEAARALLVRYAEDDTKAFNQVMAAFKLPKETEVQAAARKATIAAANLRTTTIPMQTAEESIAVCQALEQVVRFANDNVMSDCGVALECAKTAATGALMNVSINLPGVKDERQAAVFAARLETLKQKLAFHYDSAIGCLRSRFDY